MLEATGTAKLKGKKAIIEGTTVALGKEGAIEPLTLGLKLNDNLKDLLREISKLNSTLQTFATTQVAASVAPTTAVLTPGFTKLSADLTALSPNIAKITGQLIKHLSVKVKTE